MATTAMQVSRLIASPPIGSCSGPTFSNTTMLLEAAAAGQGVALAGHVLVAGDIAQGKLVRPFGECAGTPLRLAYHLVYRPGAPVRNPRLAALRQWLMAEAAQHEATRLANRAEGSEGVMAGEDAT